MDGTSSPQLEGQPLTNWEVTENAFIFRIEITGTPKPKARPRTVRNPHTGFTQTYTPSSTVNWEQTIVAQTKQVLAALAVHAPDAGQLMPFTGRLQAEMMFYVNKPQSAPKSVQYPLKAKPGDIDNMAKSVLDAMQLSGVIGDDKTVTDLYAGKRFATGDHPEGVYLELVAWRE